VWLLAYVRVLLLMLLDADTGIVTDDRFDADTGIVTDDRFVSVGIQSIKRAVQLGGLGLGDCTVGRAWRSTVR